MSFFVEKPNHSLSLDRCLNCFLMSFRQRRTEVSTTNNFGFEVKPSDKSLILIRKNDGRIMYPWGTPALILAHDECCPIKTTLFFPTQKSITFKRFLIYHLASTCRVDLHAKP